MYFLKLFLWYFFAGCLPWSSSFSCSQLLLGSFMHKFSNLSVLVACYSVYLLLSNLRYLLVSVISVHRCLVSSIWLNCNFKSSHFSPLRHSQLLCIITTLCVIKAWNLKTFYDMMDLRTRSTVSVVVFQILSAKGVYFSLFFNMSHGNSRPDSHCYTNIFL